MSSNRPGLLRHGFTRSSIGSASETDARRKPNTVPKNIVGDASTSAGLNESSNFESDIESDTTDGTSAPRAKKGCRKNYSRKYQEEYLRYGFVSSNDDPPLPMCVVCSKTLSNESMKPTKMLRHLKTNHHALEDKPVEYFQRLKSDLKGRIHKMSDFTQTESAAIRTSFRIAHRIAKCKKPFNIAETLIKPCLLDTTTEMLNVTKNKVESIPLSSRTIARRVEAIALNIEEQLCTHLKKSGLFALQFDESTDINNEAILIGYVRYIKENEIVEDMLCYSSLPNYTTGEEIFRAIDETFGKYELSWANVVGVCTDGASNMRGCRKGLIARIAKVANKNCRYTHCIIHREALAVHGLSAELTETLNIAVKMVNSIKSRSLNCRIFTEICNELGADHQYLLFHNSVRWLSPGKVLSRLHELLHEFNIFVIEHTATHSHFIQYLEDDKWKIKLAYLADIFGHLNELNLQIQGKGMNCFIFMNKIDAFKKKMVMWRNMSRAANFEMFPLVSEKISNNNQLTEYISKIIDRHLNAMTGQFGHYFPPNTDPRKNNLWVPHL